MTMVLLNDLNSGQRRMMWPEQKSMAIWNDVERKFLKPGNVIFDVFSLFNAHQMRADG